MFLLLILVVLGFSDLVDIIEEVNSANLAWKATSNKFVDWKMDELRKLMGYNDYVEKYYQKMINHHSKKDSEIEQKNLYLPNGFDWRNESYCVHPIRNQGDCGSCYAFGTTESFSDRLCISSKGKIDVVISPQNLMDCEILNLGCDGGIPYLCWEHIKNKGLVSDSCVPYIGSKQKKCEKDRCTFNASQPFTKYFASEVSIIEGSEHIQSDLMNHGPQTTAFMVFEDFMTYESGIYSYHKGGIVGGHVVKIVGWGENEHGKYWIVANSWGKNWGLNGYFWIKRGVKPIGECGIEGEVVSGIPKL